MRPLGQFRPGMPAPTPADARPHAIYKAEMRARLRAFAPDSVLDVGCGAGALLRELQAAGCPRCIGLEVDPTLHAALRDEGIEAVAGHGEALPFPDRSIDIVVLEYTAHHLADLGAGLREAARVARRAVILLDPWYDDSLSSQRVARDYDLWCKAIDRRLGLIHDPCPTFAQLAQPFRERGGFRLEATHRLILQPLSLERVQAEGRAHLDRIPGARDAEVRALAGILDRAEADGISDDGALLFIAALNDRA